MTGQKPIVFIVEDDRKLAELIASYLQKNGFVTEIEGRGDRAIHRILENQPDLVVLDVMLPGAGGLEVCKQVRPAYRGPILILTALGDEDDEVLGLETGADDYLAKPVRPRVLLSHIQALLRRYGRASNDQINEIVNVGAIVIDLPNRTVSVNGQFIELTTAEFNLLWLLASHRGNALTRDQIFLELRGIPYDGLDRSIDLRINRIRRKIGDDGKTPRWIKTVHGVGYLLVVQT